MSEVEFDKLCDLCQTPVRVVGEETQHYESAYPQLLTSVAAINKLVEELEAKIRCESRDACAWEDRFHDKCGELDLSLQAEALLVESLKETEGIILKFQNAHDDNAYIMAEKAGNKIDEALAAHAKLREK